MAHFAKLTSTTGTPMYINCDMVAAVYQFQPECDDALVQFVGDDDSYIRAKESVEKTMDIIYDAMQE